MLIASSCGSDGEVASSSSSPLGVAAALDVTDESTHTVEGFALAVDGKLRLCSVLAESYPPQCGNPSLVVVGDATADLPGLFGELLKTEGSTAWTDEPVQLTGSMLDGELHLDP